jgi:hypothetical protein
VSTDASASTSANAPVRAVATATADNASASDVERNESIESIGALIQDLFHSDNAKVDDTLDALAQHLEGDKEKCDIFVKAGGSFTLVQLVNDCLKKASTMIPACDRVTNIK